LLELYTARGLAVSGGCLGGSETTGGRNQQFDATPLTFNLVALGKVIAVYLVEGIISLYRRSKGWLSGHISCCCNQESLCIA